MKKGIKILLIASAFFCFGAAGLAAKPLDNTTAVGVYATGNVNLDAASAYGLQFEKQFSRRFGLGLLGAAYYDDKFDNFSTNVNLEVKYTLIDSDFGNHFGSRFYIYTMGGYNGWSSFSKNESGEKVVNYINDAFVSVGFGLEFLLVDHLSLPVNFGFAGRFPYEPNAGFCLGAGIRYSF